MITQARVALGAPLGFVDAVEYAEEHLAPRAQEAVEADAMLGRLDFARVRRADGGDGMSVEDSTGQKRKDAGAQVVVVGQVDRNARLGQHLRGERTLMAQVVDR